MPGICHFHFYPPYGGLTGISYCTKFTPVFENIILHRFLHFLNSFHYESKNCVPPPLRKLDLPARKIRIRVMVAPCANELYILRGCILLYNKPISWRFKRLLDFGHSNPAIELHWLSSWLSSGKLLDTFEIYFLTTKSLRTQRFESHHLIKSYLYSLRLRGWTCLIA